MNSNLLILFIFSLCLILSSTNGADRIKSSLLELKQSGQQQTARSANDAISFSQILGSALGVMATGRVGPAVAPALVKVLVLPLMLIVKSIARGLMFVGVMSYLVSALVPAILSYIGLAGSVTFARGSTLNNWVFTPVNEYVLARASNVANLTLNYLQLNNDECKQFMYCKAGRYMAEQHPIITDLMKNYGVLKFIELSSIDNKTITLVNALNSSNCESELKECPNFRSIEDIFTQIENRIVQMISPGQPMPSTPTSTSPPPTTSTLSPEGILNGINSLLKSYYTTDNSSGKASSSANSWSLFS